MPDNDNLDLLLDSALSTYADPGANSGLEQRILARVFSSVQTAPAARLRWLPWTIALAAAACLFLIVVFSVVRRTNPSVDHASHAQGAKQPLIAANSNQTPVTQRRATPHAASSSAFEPHPQPAQAAAISAALPKLDVFPTPQPLTREEHALAIFAIHAPARELQALIEAQKQDDAPLSVTAIDIQPLDPPDQGGN